MEPDGVRSASVPLQNSMPSRDQAETHTTNYKAVSSTAGGQSYAHKRFLSLITPHWLLLHCLKVSSTGSENSRGPSTQARVRFQPRWDLHFGKCTDSSGGSVSFSINADPELLLCWRKQKRSKSTTFMVKTRRKGGSLFLLFFKAGLQGSQNI